MQVVEHGDGIFVTRDGRVFSGRQGSLKEKRQRPHYKGYMLVHIGRLKTPKTVFVHRLVLEAFDGPRPGMVCMHLNNDRRDNRIDNLQWGTPKQNSEQMVRENRKRGRERRLDHASIRSAVGSHAEVARKHGCTASSVSLIRRGLRGDSL